MMIWIGSSYAGTQRGLVSPSGFPHAARERIVSVGAARSRRSVCGRSSQPRRYYRQCGGGSGPWAQLYREYAEATCDRQAMHCSSSLRRLLRIENATASSDESAATRTAIADAEPLVVIPFWLWRLVL